MLSSVSSYSSSAPSSSSSSLIFPCKEQQQIGIGWSLEDMIIINNHLQPHMNTINSTTTTTHHQQHQLPIANISSQPDYSVLPSPTTHPMVKKLSHNANERDRRKKISTLYSSLRSLLPTSHHQSKKLSIPATIANVLKYIPELQKELEKLSQKKKRLSSSPLVACRRNSNNIQDDQEIDLVKNTSISVTSLGGNDKEILVQLCRANNKMMNKSLLSKVVQKLEEDGLHLLNASSIESFGDDDDKIIHSLHLLQVHENLQCDLQILHHKLLKYSL